MATPREAFRSKTALASAPKIVGKEEADTLQEAIQDRISQRAYQLYEQSGCQPGNEQNHWFQAERDVLRRELEVRGSGGWIAVNGSIPRVSAEDVQIYVDQQRIIVRAQRQPGATGEELGESETFFVADLPVEVEPATASAALKDHQLSLMVKKRFPVTVGRLEFANGR